MAKGLDKGFFAGEGAVAVGGTAVVAETDLGRVGYDVVGVHLTAHLLGSIRPECQLEPIGGEATIAVMEAGKGGGLI